MEWRQRFSIVLSRGILTGFLRLYVSTFQREYEQLLRCQIATFKRGRHSKYLPYVFTENGVAMLSSVLNEKRAIHVNIQIMRTYTKLRKLVATHKDLKRTIEQMEKI
jgi:hypothetical protein